jgi:hypothetical protein
MSQKDQGKQSNKIQKFNMFNKLSKNKLSQKKKKKTHTHTQNIKVKQPL